MSTLIIITWIVFAIEIVLFNVLYFCVVLLRVNDAGGNVIDVKGHSETLEDVFVRTVKSDGRG